MVIMSKFFVFRGGNVHFSFHILMSDDIDSVLKCWRLRELEVELEKGQRLFVDFSCLDWGSGLFDGFLLGDTLCLRKKCFAPGPKEFCGLMTVARPFLKGFKA